jgi:hypothetical protein
MTLSLKHNFVSGKGDGTDASQVQPSNWNAEHAITCSADSLIGRGATAGSVTEISCTTIGRALISYATKADALAYLEGLSTTKTAAQTMAGALNLPADGLNVGSGALQVTGGNVSASGTMTDVLGNVRNVPANVRTAAYTLLATDSGKFIAITTGGITLPADVFAVGNTITIYNNSTSAQTITASASVTLRLVGSSLTGNRTLNQYGLCTLLCVASNVFAISGGGLA